MRVSSLHQCGRCAHKKRRGTKTHVHRALSGVMSHRSSATYATKEGELKSCVCRCQGTPRAASSRQARGRAWNRLIQSPPEEHCKNHFVYLVWAALGSLFLHGLLSTRGEEGLPSCGAQAQGMGTWVVGAPGL